jgi:hypothetical protein
METRNDVTGSLIFNLDTYEGKDEMIASLRGPEFKRKIDELYDEVFRPFVKYDRSFIGVTEDKNKYIDLEIKSEKDNIDLKMKISPVIAGAIEEMVIEAVLEQIQRHFAREEE